MVKKDSKVKLQIGDTPLRCPLPFFVPVFLRSGSSPVHEGDYPLVLLPASHPLALLRTPLFVKICATFTCTSCMLTTLCV